MEKFREYGRKWNPFYNRKSYWQQELHPREYAVGAGVGVIAIAVIAWLFYHSWIAFLVLFGVLLPWMRKWIDWRVNQKQRKFEQQFKEAMNDFAVALGAGYSVENAMKEAYRDLARMYDQETVILRELAYMNRQIEMNLPAERVWEDCASRLQQPDVEQFAVVFATAKRSGGNLIEIMKSVAETITARTEVKREIRTLLTEKKYEFQVMMCIPFGILFYMKAAFPEFMDVLYGNLLGVVIMTVCLAVYLAACKIGFSIVNIQM